MIPAQKQRQLILGNHTLCITNSQIVVDCFAAAVSEKDDALFAAFACAERARQSWM